MSAQLTQEAVEVLSTPDSKIRNHQTIVEVLYTPDSKIRSHQEVVEILSTPDSKIRSHQLMAEILYSPTLTVQLSWTDNSSIETQFSIERGTDGVSFSEIDTVSADVTTYEDAGLEPGTYYYRVRAYDGSTGIYSDYSNTANVTVS